MSSLSRALHPKHGPLLPVQLHPPSAWIGGGANRSPSQPMVGWGLIDTGARQSGVDLRAAQRLGLRSQGVKELLTPASHTESVPIFHLCFGFPEVTQRFQHELLGLRLGYLVDEQPVLLLLGRDFLRGRDLHYLGATGEFQLSWPDVLRAQ